MDVPGVCHDLQLHAFTSQVVEEQLGTGRPLGMDATCQSFHGVNIRSAQSQTGNIITK